MLDLVFTLETSGTASEKKMDKWRQRPGDKGRRQDHLTHGVRCRILFLQVHSCQNHSMKVNVCGKGMSLSFPSWRGLHHNYSYRHSYRQDLAMTLLPAFLESKFHIKSKLISSAQHMAKAVYISHPTFNLASPPSSAKFFTFFLVHWYKHCTHFLKHAFLGLLQRVQITMPEIDFNILIYNHF